MLIVENCLFKGYRSASSTIRYLSFDEIKTLLLDFYENLITYGHISLHQRAIDSNKGDELDLIFLIKESQKYKIQFKTPETLKIISRNRVRDLLQSISHKTVDALHLPSNVVRLIRAEEPVF
jgi:hypothetical protein